MLRKINLQDPWRSLDTNFWPNDLPAGRRTVVYGHNGSGKSTLSELLLSLSEGSSLTNVIWEDEHKINTKIGVGESIGSPAVAVFTRKWVEKNLSDFLDGDSASAIVTLGKDAIDAKEEEKQLKNKFHQLRDEAEKAEKHGRETNQKIDKLAREVQDRVISELQEFDHAHFTRNRYSLPKIKDSLRAYKGSFPDSNRHAEALKHLAEGAPGQVPPIAEPPVSSIPSLSDLSELLSETPTRLALETLERNPKAQSWVEQGLKLHIGIDHCLFRAEQLTEVRRAQLAQHFDESWLRIRSKAKSLLEAVTRAKYALTTWYAGIPTESALASDLKSTFETAKKPVQVALDSYVRSFELLEDVLTVKVNDPSTTPDPPNLLALNTELPTSALAAVVIDHNERVLRHEAVTDERKQIVLSHLYGSRSADFCELEQSAENFLATKLERDAAAAKIERRLEEIRQARFTTKDMADTLTKDLAQVYGKDHLSVIVTPDGKSYSCRRGYSPGKNLSEGERMTLSLLYFLRNLQDEQAVMPNLSERVVIIDDPSSSLDRESVFATHQWLVDTLKDFGQYIILTHDFSLLRLTLKSHSNAWGQSLKNIRNQDAEEIRFPKVAFLEMYSCEVDGKRRSRVGQLPSALLKSTSEYTYLFSMVMAGVIDSADHERLFLLPNAARRVLEVFASYKAPHRTDFRQQLEVLISTKPGEPFRDVFDFCNRFSHGEGGETLELLDARAVHRQIRRCMEFLKAIDNEHFERMCKATDQDSSMLA